MHANKAYSICRLFEELWIPLVNDSFEKGATVYMHLTGPRGKYLLHEAQMQPGLEQPPTTNAGKLQLLDALMALINSNRFDQMMPTAKPEEWQGDDATAHKAPSTPPMVAELPVSAAAPRKLGFDGSNIDRAGVSALMRVYLDGHMGLTPFIKYFPVPSSLTVPAQFIPEEAKHPGWEASKLADQWLKRRDVAFEVCMQASPLQQAVNARVLAFEARRQEACRQSKAKFVAHEVSMDLRTAASKVAALLQAAMQTNKQNSCHPQSIVTLSTMFKDLRAGRQDAEVHRSSKKGECPQRLPASSLQGWLSIASSNDVDAMVAELYA